MISAFEVYLVMQLDVIRNSIDFIIFIFISISAITGFVCFVPYISDKDRMAIKKICFNSFYLFLFIGVVNMVIPSSKTAATMIVLPALTDKEVVDTAGKEFKELYGIAKDALKELVKNDKQTDTKYIKTNRR